MNDSLAAWTEKNSAQQQARSRTGCFAMSASVFRRWDYQSHGELFYGGLQLES